MSNSNKELRTNFKPVGGGRMTSVKGFSLRLSAHLVYGVSVVYNLKVVHLYKDATASMQSLHRFQSQLQLYPVETTIPPVLNISHDLPETFRQEDPMFGQLPVDFAIGSGYLTQLSSSDVTSDGSFQVHQQKELLPFNYAVKDISTITLLDDVPKTTIPFADDHHLLEGEDLTGPGIINDMIRDMADIYTAIPDFQTVQRTASNVTPASGLQTSVKMPPRPSKSRPESPTQSKTSEETLAVPLSSPRASISASKPRKEDLSNAVEAVDIVADPEAEHPVGPNQSSLEAASDTTTELILPPITEEVHKQKLTHSHPLLIVDKRTELHSDVIRNQLTAPLNSIEEYMTEGNLDILPASFSNVKELFEQPTSVLLQNLPSRVDPYLTASTQTRGHHRHRKSLPHLLFTDMIKNISTSDVSPASPGFSAHREAVGDTELLRPEDEFEALQNGPMFDQTQSSIGLADETFATEGSSIQRIRDVSRLSNMPRSLGEGFTEGLSDAEQVGTSGKLDQTEMQSEIESALNELDFPLPPTELVSGESADLLHKYDATRRAIEDLDLKTDSPVMFGSLVPPGRARCQAARVFYDILMLAKNGQVNIHQAEPYEEILITYCH